MRSLLIAMIAILISTSAYAHKPAQLKTFQDSVAYAIGMNIGNNLLNDSLFLNVDIIKAGLNDALNTRNTVLTQQQIEQIFQQFSMQMQEKQMVQQKAAGEINLKKGKEFLEQNKKNQNVKVTESGLQYQVIKEANSGRKPKATDKVKVHYTGTLIDGTVFDSSVERGEPISFPLNGVISGWTEGVQLMSVGSKYKFFIPAHLAYGERGAGGSIGPNETLIFEVELLDIEQD